MGKHWSKEEVEFLIKNSPFVTDEEGARQLSLISNRKISKNTWSLKRRLLGLNKKTGRPTGHLPRIAKKKSDQSIPESNSTNQNNVVIPNPIIEQQENHHVRHDYF
jgi:hypothetical protein